METKIILMGKELKDFKLVEYHIHEDVHARRYTIEGYIQKPYPEAKKPKPVPMPSDGEPLRKKPKK